MHPLLQKQIQECCPQPGGVPPELQALLSAVDQTYARLDAERSLAERPLAASEQEALRESEERFRAFMDNTPAVAVLKDHEGRILWVNRPFEQAFGARLAELVGRTDAERWPPAIAAHLAEQQRAVIEGGRPVQLVETLPTPAGDRTWLSLRFPFRNAAGSCLLGGVAIDVTEQRRAEQERERAEAALRASEARYRLLFESNPQPMFVFDSETLAFVAVNDATVAHYGFAREDFLAMRLPDLLAPEDRPALFDGLQTSRHTATHQRRVRHLRQDGSRITVEVLSHRVQLGGRDARLVLVTDVTERQRLEEHLRQKQKMEAIGLLAGGVAHDFNNLLTVISGYGALAARDLAPESRPGSYLAEMLRAADRAAALTHQLLAFSRQQVMQPRVLDLNVLLGEMQRLLQRIVSEDVELVLALSPGLGHVLADPAQLEQVVMNLVVNASDAMPGGGRLTLSTSHARLAGGEGATDLSVAGGEYVRLTVSDTGIGMSTETRSRAFEPFFTTKDKGRGTGLGLSTVYGVVKQSGGCVWLDSQPGQGCRVEVYLPRIEQPAVPETAAPPSSTVMADGAGETVVVAEDEASVRALVTEILGGCGYRVLTAASGREALDLCRHHQGPIDLLLTDVVMPEMNGPELVRRMAGIHPETRALFMSGYSDRAIADAALDLDVGLLEKPFAPAHLLCRVRELLENGRAGAHPLPAPCGASRGPLGPLV
jgi:two-component system cell cycle sensor histidine kinase/response regulator CckA